MARSWAQYKVSYAVLLPYISLMSQDGAKCNKEDVQSQIVEIYKHLEQFSFVYIIVMTKHYII